MPPGRRVHPRTRQRERWSEAKAPSGARPSRVFVARQIRKGVKAVGVWEGACPLYNWEGWSERSERNLQEATPAAACE